MENKNHLTPEQIHKIGTAEIHILGTWELKERNLKYRFKKIKEIGDKGIVIETEFGNTSEGEYWITYEKGILTLFVHGRQYRIWHIKPQEDFMDLEDVLGKRLIFTR